MNYKPWYAIMKDEIDDWGTGSFDVDEAVKLAIDYGYDIIVEIDGNYDDDGKATSDPIAVREYHRGIDF